MVLYARYFSPFSVTNPTTMKNTAITQVRVQICDVNPEQPIDLF